MADADSSDEEPWQKARRLKKREESRSGVDKPRRLDQGGKARTNSRDSRGNGGVRFSEEVNERVESPPPLTETGADYQIDEEKAPRSISGSDGYQQPDVNLWPSQPQNVGQRRGGGGFKQWCHMMWTYCIIMLEFLFCFRASKRVGTNGTNTGGTRKMGYIVIMAIWAGAITFWAASLYPFQGVSRIKLRDASGIGVNYYCTDKCRNVYLGGGQEAADALDKLKIPVRAVAVEYVCSIVTLVIFAVYGVLYVFTCSCLQEFFRCCCEHWPVLRYPIGTKFMIFRLLVLVVHTQSAATLCAAYSVLTAQPNYSSDLIQWNVCLWLAWALHALFFVAGISRFFYEKRRQPDHNKGVMGVLNDRTRYWLK